MHGSYARHILENNAAARALSRRQEEAEEKGSLPQPVPVAQPQPTKENKDVA